jgi:hypothetical protein
MFEELLRARLSDLRVSAVKIEHRMEWQELVEIDRLEQALKTAKSRKSPGLPPPGSALPHAESIGKPFGASR